MRKRGILLFGGLAVVALAGSFVRAERGDQQAGSAAISPSPIASQQAVLNRYCLSCHNDKMKTGGLSLSGADIANLAAQSDVWEKVVRKLHGRSMPPIGRPRPDEATYESPGDLPRRLSRSNRRD